MEDVYYNMENILTNYPKDWLNNYYTNKKDVKIIKKNNILENNSICGQYICNENIIELVHMDVIYHELAHMAFNDRKKYNTKVFNIDDNMYYENGVVINIKKGKENSFLYKAINEGFAEYLSRKNCDFKGQDINYYFTNFLIKIYGEDLIKYPLTNDPLGLLSDNRFYNISKFLDNLDNINNFFSAIIVADNISKRNKKINMKNIINNLCKEYNLWIIQTFNSLLLEYRYSDKLISNDEFIELIYSFNNYDLFNTFDNKKYNIKEYIKSYKI